MNRARAVEIIQALANGIDPISGQTFADESPLQNAEVTRALFLAAKELKNSNPKKGPLNNKAKWTTAEENQLITLFREGMKLKDLAKKHDRSKGAVKARLQKLGEIGYDTDELEAL